VRLALRFEKSFVCSIVSKASIYLDDDPSFFLFLVIPSKHARKTHQLMRLEMMSFDEDHINPLKRETEITRGVLACPSKRSPSRGARGKGRDHFPVTAESPRIAGGKKGEGHVLLLLIIV
jgi:hypothetical protein